MPRQAEGSPCLGNAQNSTRRGHELSNLMLKSALTDKIITQVSLQPKVFYESAILSKEIHFLKVIPVIISRAATKYITIKIE